jgi:hypothetical protein
MAYVKLPGLDSNQDKESQNSIPSERKSNVDKTSEQGSASLSAVLAQQALTDPDLARVIGAWGLLPQHIRIAILALIHTAGK